MFGQWAFDFSKDKLLSCQIELSRNCRLPVPIYRYWKMTSHVNLNLSPVAAELVAVQ